MATSLFDDIPRTSLDPANHNTAHFNYLNESARKYCGKARKSLSAWYLEYKKRHGKSAAEELRGRFRSTNNAIHNAALTELYLHHFLIKQGYAVKLHPRLPKTTTHPDFLVLKEKKCLFYLEAKSLSGKEVKKRQSLFENKILDMVDELSSPAFLVSINFKKSSDLSLPTLSKLKKKLQEKVDSLDHRLVCKKYESDCVFPALTYTDNNWEVEFEFTPVKDEAINERNNSSRVVGAISYPAKSIHLDDEIKKAVRNKLNKYKNIDLPFLLAINVVSDSIFCDDYTIMAALFGKMTYTFSTFPDGSRETIPGRTMDGILVDPKHGRIGTRLSGLFVLNGLHFHNADSLKPIIWHNPHARLSFDPSLIKAQHMIYAEKSNKMERIDS